MAHGSFGDFGDTPRQSLESTEYQGQYQGYMNPNSLLFYRDIVSLYYDRAIGQYIEPNGRQTPE